MIDLISERVGGRVLDFNDEFFAPARNLISAAEPVANDEYTDRGKWMDGWETRRRRQQGHDWCVLALGIPGRITRVTVDTSNFTGNYPEQFSLEAAGIDDRDRAEWVEVIPRTDLMGDSRAVFEVEDPHRVELVRLNIFPDGGVARLQVEGDPVPAMQLVCPEQTADLAVASVGGEVVDASDLHYSHPSNLLRPVGSAGMWDGWETKRRRDDGHDWVTVRLGLAGSVESITVDTTNFKGNAPGWVSCEVSDDGLSWARVADRVPVESDRPNRLEVESSATARLLRLSIHPDGGVARLRVHGRPSADSAADTRLDYVNSLFEQAARNFFNGACVAGSWVREMVSRRPYESIGSILEASGAVFDELGETDWLEAFGGHPRIGERGDGTANEEQSGAEDAGASVLGEIAAVNRQYEESFGFTYIVYATGKTAEEMLDIALGRVGNTRAEEIANAAAEQRRITETRLRRMLCQEST
jgi:allantoicase